MLLLIVAGILFILAILTEWGTGSKTYGPVFVCLSGLLTMAAGLVWVVLMIKVLLSAWILTAGCFIFFLGECMFFKHRQSSSQWNNTSLMLTC